MRRIDYHALPAYSQQAAEAHRRGFEEIINKWEITTLFI
jgi:hypothetical protein